MNGATGAYGTAAVLLGLAMGAARVAAAGRNAAALEALVEVAGPRVAAVQLSGDLTADAAKLRGGCGGGADIAFDMVGRAGDANATLAALKSLRRGGRLVLMGSRRPRCRSATATSCAIIGRLSASSCIRLEHIARAWPGTSGTAQSQSNPRAAVSACGTTGGNGCSG